MDPLEQEELWEEADEAYQRVLHQNKARRPRFGLSRGVGSSWQRGAILFMHRAASAAQPAARWPQCECGCLSTPNCAWLQGYHAHKRLKWLSILVSFRKGCMLLQSAAWHVQDSLPCRCCLEASFTAVHIITRCPCGVLAFCVLHGATRDCTPLLQVGKLAPLAGPQPPFHHTSLDPKSELLCGKDYWRRKPDRVYEDEEEEEDEDGAFVRCA